MLYPLSYGGSLAAIYATRPRVDKHLHLYLHRWSQMESDLDIVESVLYSS